jgi:hypothetical protein
LLWKQLACFFHPKNESRFRAQKMALSKTRSFCLEK